LGLLASPLTAFIVGALAGEHFFNPDTSVGSHRDARRAQPFFNFCELDSRPSGFTAVNWECVFGSALAQFFQTNPKAAGRLWKGSVGALNGVIRGCSGHECF
jgi:hypothetical protein